MSEAAMLVFVLAQMVSLPQMNNRLVAEAREAERRLSAEKETLASLNRLKTEVMANVSHELNSPDRHIRPCAAFRRAASGSGKRPRAGQNAAHRLRGGPGAHHASAGEPDCQRRALYGRAPGGGDTGNGLGLYICRYPVEAHGGVITAESTVGLGTTITFSLPAG